MDLLIKEAISDFSSFRLNHLNAAPGASPVSFNLDSSKWDWSQLFDLSSFDWKVGTTPMSDLRVRR